MATSRRELIRMTDDEVATFVDARLSLQVGTIERDGSIHLSTLWYAVIGGNVVFETYSRSQKIVNLERDDRITVLCEDGTKYEQLRGVMVRGRAILHAEDGAGGADEVRRVARAVMRRNEPDIPEEHFEGAVGLWAAKRTVVIVEPEKVITWDHSKLGGVY